MTNYTDLEKRVFNVVLAVSYDGASVEVAEVAEALGVSKATVKGAVGSLVKKGKVFTEEREVVNFGKKNDVYHEIYPIFENHDEWGGSFGCDVASFEEWMAERL